MTLFLTTATIPSAQNATSSTMGVYYDRETGLYYDIPLRGDYYLDFNEQISMSEDPILEISVLCSEEVIENRSLIS
jgi:hypothetical protein